MTCFRKIVSTITLLISLSFIQPVSAEPEKESTEKSEQRESGGKLLRFLFGEDDETDSQDKEGLEPTETVATPSGKETIETEETNELIVVVPAGEVPAVLTVEPLKSDVVKKETPTAVDVPGQEREGLTPPPGFTDSVPTNDAEKIEKGPVKDIVVEQLPATPTLSGSETVAIEPRSEKETSKELELNRLSKENPVVAIVEGDRIYWEDIMQAARKLPEQYQGNLETMFPLLLDRAIDLKLLAHAGADADVDRDEAVKRKLALAEEKIIRDAFLEQKLNEMISESMLKDRYFSLLRENIINAEIRARHILVETRNEALALIIALENGANFPLLAKKFSRGPSADKGGDLGWFRRKDMDPEFATSAFNLKKGQFTQTPVSTEFGWHVILLEDKRDVKQPTFESMRAEIKEIVSRDLIAVMVRELREDADISVFPAK